ncbi:hypothetical protein C8R44DRAFT_845883 [Mycena epipterygia]|nr:hypothetical protein C8R44DRAFT_845883 [Mycena epipterygia]
MVSFPFLLSPTFLTPPAAGRPTDFVYDAHMGGRTGDATSTAQCGCRTLPIPFRSLAWKSNVDWGAPHFTGGIQRGGSTTVRQMGPASTNTKTLYGLVRAGERGLQRRRTRQASTTCIAAFIFNYDTHAHSLLGYNPAVRSPYDLTPHQSSPDLHDASDKRTRV